MTTCVIDGVAWDVLGDLGSTAFVLDVNDLDAAGDLSALTPAYAAIVDSIGGMLLSASWSWGATRPLGPLTEPSAGRAVLSLLDTERLFDPLNATSPRADYMKAGLPIRLLADAVPAWTGRIREWTHDLGAQESQIELIDVIGELGLTDALPSLGNPASLINVTTFGYADVIGYSGFSLNGAQNVLPGAEPVLPASDHRAMYLNSDLVAYAGSFMRTNQRDPEGSVLEALAPIRFAEHAALHGSPEGRVYWRGSQPRSVPAPRLTINCGGVMLETLTTTIDHDRIRNQVRITGASPEVYYAESSIARHGVREVVTTVADLALATEAAHLADVPPLPAGDPYARWAAMILDELAEPHPIIALGLLRPKGPAEVVPMANARYLDRWRVIDDHVVPAIDRYVRVLGARCRLVSTGLEVDAVTEDE